MQPYMVPGGQPARRGDDDHPAGRRSEGPLQGAEGAVPRDILRQVCQLLGRRSGRAGVSPRAVLQRGHQLL